MIKTDRYVSVQRYVHAVQVTEENMVDVSHWCKGGIRTTDKGEKYIKVRVANPLSDRQTMAFVGCWVLKGHTGFKVYTDSAFNKSFTLYREPTAPTPPISEVEDAEIRDQAERMVNGG